MNWTQANVGCYWADRSLTMIPQNIHFHWPGFSTPANPTSWPYGGTVILQRVGVSGSLRAMWEPCPHGHHWYAEVIEYQQRGYICTISSPNCYECHGDERGQVRFGFDSHNPLVTSPAPLAMVLAWLQSHLDTHHTGLRIAPFVAASSYQSPKCLELWPHCASDVYVTCARYEPGTDTIRHARTNVCLVSFDPTNPALCRWDIDAAAKPYVEQIARAASEYVKAHNQRMGADNAKRWLTWLLGEYIKDNVPGEIPVVLHSIDCRRIFASRVIAELIGNQAPEQTAANARLIAAAPDLLAALEKYQTFAENNYADSDLHDADGSSWIAQGRAAIAKAKGGA